MDLIRCAHFNTSPDSLPEKRHVPRTLSTPKRVPPSAQHTKTYVLIRLKTENTPVVHVSTSIIHTKPRLPVQAMDITLPRGMSLTVTSPEITNDDANRRDILPEMTVFGVKIAVTAGGANHRTDAAFRANRRAVTTCPSGKGYRLGKVCEPSL